MVFVPHEYTSKYNAVSLYKARMGQSCHNISSRSPFDILGNRVVWHAVYRFVYSLTLFHMIGAFKDPRMTNSLTFFNRFNRSPRENYFRSAGQNVCQAFNALPDILICCWTFFSVNDQQILCFMSDIRRTFSMYWTLPDKMSGNVGAPCRTSAEVCRTCPACPAYFARTV